MRDKECNILLPLAMVIGIMTGIIDRISAYPIELNRELISSIGPEYDTDSTTNPIVKETTSPATSATTSSSDGPKRDWSNPPGFKGYSNHANGKMKKHKGLTPNKKRHKYHPKKKGRCYSF